MRSRITKGELTILDKLTLKKSDLERELQSVNEALELFGSHPDLAKAVDFLDNWEF